MKCVNCGADLKSEWAFCPHCGAGVSEPLRPEVQIKLFVKEFSNGRKEYRYGKIKLSRFSHRDQVE